MAILDASLIRVLVGCQLARHSRNATAASSHIKRLVVHAVQWLVSLNEYRDSGIIRILLRTLRLHFDASTRVLFKLATNFVIELRVIAIIRVIRHVPVFVRPRGLERIRLVSVAQIVGLSVKLFDIIRSH